MLPSKVLAPGSRVAPLSAQAAAKSGLRPSCTVCAGTTDSIAAFVAAGVSRPGQVRGSVLRQCKAGAGPWARPVGAGVWLLMSMYSANLLLVPLACVVTNSKSVIIIPFLFLEPYTDPFP